MKFYLLLILLFITHFLIGQTYVLEKSVITFFSEAPLENIQATTHTAKGIFKVEGAQVAFQIPMNTFQFKKALMQEHFNENYLESEKYPNATFSGKILPFKNTSSNQKVEAIGNLTIHGVTREVKISGSLVQKDDSLLMKAKFPVRIQDYDIKIPKVVFYNIAEVVDVDVEFLFIKN